MIGYLHKLPTDAVHISTPSKGSVGQQLGCSRCLPDILRGSKAVHKSLPLRLSVQEPESPLPGREEYSVTVTRKAHMLR